VAETNRSIRDGSAGVTYGRQPRSFDDTGRSPDSAVPADRCGLEPAPDHQLGGSLAGKESAPAASTGSTASAGGPAGSLRT